MAVLRLCQGVASTTIIAAPSGTTTPSGYPKLRCSLVSKSTLHHMRLDTIFWPTDKAARNRIHATIEVVDTVHQPDDAHTEDLE